MAENTLSPVGFESSRVVKTHMEPQERYALACIQGELEAGDRPQAAFVRYLVMLGMEQLGWTEARRIKEWADYRLQCIETGKHNPYESE